MKTRWRRLQHWKKASRLRNLEGMKRHTLATALLTAASACAFAQGRTDGKTDKSVAKKIPPAAVFLGSSEQSGGVIPDHLFDSLGRQPVTARDKDGNAAQVLGFTVTFAERTLAEDSAGNPIIAVDFFSEKCSGDTLTPVLRNNLFERTKPGDTVWYERIRVATAAGETGGQEMKFVIGR